MVAGCEIRLALTHGMRQRRCEVALGESAVQRSPPWELAAAMRRSRFTYVCRRLVFTPTPRGSDVKGFFTFQVLKESEQSAVEYCMLFMFHLPL